MAVPLFDISRPLSTRKLAAEVGTSTMAVYTHFGGLPGLVHAVVPANQLDADVARYVNELLTAAPEAIGAAKALIRRVWMQSAEAAAVETARAIAERRVSAEGQEGLKAFLEKRRPTWASR